MKNIFTLLLAVCMLAVTAIVAAPDVGCAQSAVALELKHYDIQMPVVSAPLAIYQSQTPVAVFDVTKPLAFVGSDATTGNLLVYESLYGIRNPLPAYELRPLHSYGSTGIQDYGLHNYNYGVANPLPSSILRVQRE